MKSIHDLKITSDISDILRFRDQKLSGLKTGVPCLDRALLGLSGIVCIQGAPGSCKSTLALQVATYNAKLGIPVLYVDLENGRSRMKTRLLCQLYGAGQAEVLNAPQDKLTARASALAELPVHIEHDKIDADVLRHYVAEVMAYYKKPMLLVIDSLQASPKVSTDQRVALEQFLETINSLKMEFEGKLTTILTIEKRRGVYKEASNDAGKGTNAIEYKGEIVLDMRTANDEGNTFVIEVVKNRDGSLGQKVYVQKNMKGTDFTFTLEDAVDIEL